MFSIEQSHFLQALGQAIGHSLWQIAALWLVYAAISNVGRVSANQKYRLAAGASLAGFIWFVITLVYAYTILPSRPTLNGMYIAANTGSSFPDYLLYLYHSASASIKSLAPYISCAYLCLFVLLSIRLGNGFQQVKFFATQGLTKSDVKWRLFIQQHAGALGISRKVNLYTSQHVQSPLTLGFWKPIILMPLASVNHLTTSQVESILLHELAHIRRHDYLVNIFLQVAEISLFFNPFMRLLLKQVKQERENSCDDYVLQFQYSPKDYAKALLAIEHSNNTALLALAAKGNQSFQLLNRVKRMVAPQPKAFNYRQQLGLLLLFTILMIGFTVIIPVPKKPAPSATIAVAKKNTAEKKVLTPATAAKRPVITDAPLPAYDVIRKITNYSDVSSQSLNEEAFNKVIRESEMRAEDMDAMSKEVQESMKPVTDQVTAWANDISDAPETILTGHRLKELENLEALKNIPVEKLTEIGAEYQKKLTATLDRLLKALPFNNNTWVNNDAAANAGSPEKNRMRLAAAIKEKVVFAGQADYFRLQAAKQNLVFKQVQRELNKTMPRLQIWQQQVDEAKQLEAMAKMQRLNLGLLTDDRDTCKAEGDGLLAKLQPQKPQPFEMEMQFKTNHSFVIPPEIRINGKHPGKCVITVTENNVKIDPDAGPSSFNINGQSIDIRHETQINNGKEEKVVIISISNS